MKKTVFTGCGVALVTPMNYDRSVNFEELGRLIEFQIENGIDAIIPCGTTGEAATLSFEERSNVIKYTIDRVNHRVPVIAGTGTNDTYEALRRSQNAQEMGADALLLVTPYYNKTSQKGLVEHFNYIADRVDIPCIVYNVPSRTGVNVLPQTYLALSKHPNIVAVKEANGNIAAVSKTIALCGDDLMVYSGEDSNTLPIMALGGIGVISVFANALPNVMHRLCECMLRCDLPAAQKLQNEYLDLMEGFFMDVNPIPIKEAMNQMGFACGQCRLPLTDMSEANKNDMRALLQKHGLLK